MEAVVLVCSILFLFALIIVCKLNGFVALILSSLFVGFFMGMPMTDVIKSIELGVGGTLGHLGLIIAFGVILGRFLSEGGGAQRISMTLVKKFGKDNVGWAMAIAGFVLGITLFWEVSFMILIPIVFTVTLAAELPLLRVGVPMLAAITVTHCFLPPHPGPTAVVGIFGANLGLTLLYGLFMAIPAVIIAGPLYAKLFKNIHVEIPHHLVTHKLFAEEDLPGFGISIFVALSPVILICFDLFSGMLLPKESIVRQVAVFVGNPVIALMLSMFLALYVFGLSKKKKMPEMMKVLEAALISLGGIVFVIGGGGAFKQVILDSGMATYVGSVLGVLPISPLILAYIITSIIRLAVGSATVTVFTASAIVLPLIATSGVSPELMVLAVGAGSVFGGPPNDAAFWMTKEFFNLDMMTNIKVYCGTLTIISVVGFIGVMVMSMVV